jgi:hypothetical protein
MWIHVPAYLLQSGVVLILIFSSISTPIYPTTTRSVFVARVLFKISHATRRLPSIGDYPVLIDLIHIFCVTSPSLGSAPGVPIPSARPNRLRVQLSAPQLGCSGSQTDIRTITTNRSVIIIVIILFIL